MVENMPKYQIDETKCQSIEEIEAKIGHTKLAKVLKEVPLLKPNQLKNPSISDLFHAKMHEEEQELDNNPEDMGGLTLQKSINKKKGFFSKYLKGSKALINTQT